MDKAKFWRLIQAAKKESDGDVEEQVAVLIEKLVSLPASEIIEFGSILDELMARSYTNDLWAAAYIINGGCSDDCFDYFRGWLIAQGEQVFESSLKAPETLVDVAEPDVEGESMLYVAHRAYEEKTGKEMPRRERLAWELTGDKWDEDTVYDKYPKLAAKFA